MITKGSIRYCLRLLLAFVIPVALAALPGGRIQVSAERPQWKEIPPVETIEEYLFIKLNEERTAKGLSPVLLSPELARLARNQSREMAELGTLMHLSATGRSLKERLDAAEVLYKMSGENVARSESFVPELIHESFMKSPEHRDNILRPEFDEAGIGVVLSDGLGYFITVDFIAGLSPKSGEEVRAFLLDRLNEVRRRESGPDLVLVPEANEIAATYARARSAGDKVEANPDLLGSATIHFSSGPDLSGIAEVLTDRVSTSAPAGGIGSWFGRTARHPGGTYFVCAILLDEDPTLEWDAGRMRDAVLDAAAAARRARNLEPLAVDPALSAIARSLLFEGRKRAAPLGSWAAVYETRDLSSIPEPVRTKIESKAYGRVGLAVLRRPEKGLAATFTVAIFLDE
jgi:uncharacterized protein YkwD